MNTKIAEYRPSKQAQRDREYVAKVTEQRDTAQPDKWEPLREKLTIRQAQYLNTFSHTGDIALLVKVGLDLLTERDQQERFKWEANKRADTYKAHAQRLAEALKRKMDLSFDGRQHDQGVNIANYRAWLNERAAADNEARETLAAWEGSQK